MQRIRRTLLLLALSFGALIPSGNAFAGPLHVPAQVVVELVPGTNVPVFCVDWGVQVLDQRQGKPCYLIATKKNLDPERVCGKLLTDPRVQSASPNNYSHAPLRAKVADLLLQWTSTFNGLDGPQAFAGQSAIPQVNFNQAGSLADGAGVTVAILDTGLSWRQPSVFAQSAGGWNFVDGNANTDDSPSGLDTNGNNISDEAAGHGTMLAGLIYRFAPRAGLLPLKVLDSDGNGTLWNGILAIDYAASHGARVINISWGISLPCTAPALDHAINEASAAGILIVASAGNENGNVCQSPANNPNVVTVAALDADGTKAWFSNYGPSVAVDAPGVRVVSTYWDGRYAAWSGTSFSAPMVAAEAALILSRAPTLTAGGVRQRILYTSHSVDAVNPGYAGLLGQNGAGLIDFDAALSGL